MDIADTVEYSENGENSVDDGGNSDGSESQPQSDTELTIINLIEDMIADSMKMSPTKQSEDVKENGIYSHRVTTEHLEMTEMKELSPVEANSDKPEPLGVHEEFLTSVRDGNINVFIDILNRKDELGLDLEHKDENGDTALKIAIQEGYSVIVGQLLKQNIHVGDALLNAVDVGFVETVKTICAHVGELPKQESRTAILECHSEDGEFFPSVTPIILAAQRNAFAIVKLLLEAGSAIHAIRISHSTDESVDVLQQSVGFLEIYKGLASDAYVALGNIDPVDKAFVLSAKLQKLSKIDTSFKTSYLELADNLNALGSEIISMARSSDEILTVLNYAGGKVKHNNNSGSKIVLPKLERAIQYDQRQFVAQPNCQQVVLVKFFGRLSYIRDSSAIFRFLIFLTMMFTFPILSLSYMFVPSKWIKTRLECPYIKFMFHMCADLWFVILNAADVLFDDDHINPDLTISHPIRALLLVWIIGYGWQIANAFRKGQVTAINRKQHFSNMLLVTVFIVAAILDVISFLQLSDASVLQSNSTALTTPTNQPIITFNSTASPIPTNQPITYNSTASPTPTTQAIITYNSTVSPTPTNQPIVTDTTVIITTMPSQFQLNDSKDIDGTAAPFKGRRDPLIPSSRRRGGAGAGQRRSIEGADEIYDEFINQIWWEPRLLSNGLFGVATVLAFMRMLPYLVISDSLGPLQISLGSMLTKTSHFFLVLVVIIFSVAVGLTYLYTYTDAVNFYICNVVQQESHCELGVFANVFDSVVFLYWSIYGLEDKGKFHISNQPGVLEAAGLVLFALFFVLVVLVMLNALIAVMSNVFNDVEENADVEWKYASTTMWMRFLQEGDVVPPPFNLLPSWVDIRNGVVHLYRFLCRCGRNKTTTDELQRKDDVSTVRGIKACNDDGKASYQRVMSCLVERYVSSKTSGEVSVEAGANVTDIRALRNDLLTLKFEIFQQLQETIEDMGRTLLKTDLVKTQSVGAHSVFAHADEVHSMVRPHLEFVHELGDIIHTTVPEVIEILKPIPTAECETQTIPVEFTDGNLTDISLYKDPPMLSTRASQTSVDVHEISIQTSRDFLSDSICQTIPPPVQDDVAIQTVTGITSTQSSQAGDNDPTVRISGGELLRKRKQKGLSCLSSQVQEEVYAPTSITHLGECTAQTQAPDMSDEISQTPAPADVTEVEMQATTEHLTENFSQTTPSDSPEVFLNIIEELRAQIPIDPDINDAEIQVTMTTDVLNSDSQTNPPPDMIETYIQAKPHLNDLSVQTTREYQKDASMETMPKDTNENSSQTGEESFMEKVFSLF